MSVLDEALRYMAAGSDPETRRRAELSLEMLRREAGPRYLYRIFPLERTGEGVLLAGAGICLKGESADKMLKDCSSAALLICSIGFAFESKLRTAQLRNISEAFILDACGSALVEEACDRAEKEVSAAVPGMYLTDRFSPGYGDLPLELQRDFLHIFDGEKTLGVHLNDSLLFYPSKTVTAIIGISPQKQPARIRGCDYCSMRESCNIRKRGGSCGK